MTNKDTKEYIHSLGLIEMLNSSEFKELPFGDQFNHLIKYRKLSIIYYLFLLCAIMFALQSASSLVSGRTGSVSETKDSQKSSKSDAVVSETSEKENSSTTTGNQAVPQKSATAPGIPSNWVKSESKDSFTDKVTRRYTVFSNESRSHHFSVACSRKGDLNFYIQYPTPSTAIPGGNAEVNLRIDSDTPYAENWYVNYGGGVTVVENPTVFFEKIQNHSKLAVEIFAATRSSFDISGVKSVVLDMQSLCNFE